jgi:hypothetical protein
LAEHLTKKGFPAAFFHAGMKVEEKKAIQDEFMSSKIQTVRLPFQAMTLTDNGLGGCDYRIWNGH